MERILVNWLISSALTKMDEAHRRTHLGFVISNQEVNQVKACREFLSLIEASRENQ